VFSTGIKTFRLAGSANRLACVKSSAEIAMGDRSDRSPELVSVRLAMYARKEYRDAMVNRALPTLSLRQKNGLGHAVLERATTVRFENQFGVFSHASG
jgi:hypothetical protein